MLSGYLSVPELLELDIHSLTRIQKRNLEAHLSPDEKEALRRARISIKQVGARPWNAGLPSSEGDGLSILFPLAKSSNGQSDRCSISHLIHAHL